MAEHFPRRNALISGWSHRLLIVEAAKKSGALITARIARSQGKEVLVPPHDITRVTGKGTNKLLQEGATLYLSPDQLWEGLIIDPQEQETLPVEEVLGEPLKVSPQQEIELTDDEKKILIALENSYLNIDALQLKTGITQLELIGLVTNMELNGVVRAVPGGRYGCHSL